MQPQKPSPSFTPLRAVPLTELDFPDTFIASLYQQADSALQHQIEQFGLFQPLPVKRLGDNVFGLIAGYAYLPALRQLGYSDVPCQVCEEGTASLFSFARQIHHSLSSVNASPILQAHLIRTASQQLSQEEVFTLLPLMGFKPQGYKIQELMALLALSPDSIRALHQGYLAAKTGKLLARLHRDDQDFLVALIEKYRPGGSKQHKLVELLIELSLRLNAPIQAIIAPWTQSRPSDDPANLPQQLQGLLRYLQEQSSPHLTATEKRFQQLVRELDLPANVQLHHSTSFEDESVEWRISCEDIDRARQLWPAIERLLSAGNAR